ncbi:unnamed protein product [Oikopleura dioica]|uniref:RING-type domain-containing protein n=1 Tax=Oikopleura dioica TaxID=34765 RepID=E4Y8X4_OIKDI|nr:unnamed protein product [Oikopleura dioica]
MNDFPVELTKKLTNFAYFFRPETLIDDPEEIKRKRQTCAFDQDYIIDMDRLLMEGVEAGSIKSCYSAHAIKNQWSRYIDNCLKDNRTDYPEDKMKARNTILMRTLEEKSPEIMLTLMKVRYAVLARQTQVQIQQTCDKRRTQLVDIIEEYKSLELEHNEFAEKSRNEIRSLNTAIEKRNAKIKVLQKKETSKKNDDSKDIKKLNKIINDNRETIKSQKLEIEKLKKEDKDEELNILRKKVEYFESSAKGECSICFVAYSKTSKKCCLQCGHQFCLSCLKNMMQRLNFNCPTCRKDFSEEEIIKLF